jgi:arabinosaccharide transport system substrate-binding protein
MRLKSFASLLVTAVLLLVSILAGCGNDGNQAGTGGNQPQNGTGGGGGAKPVQLTFWSFNELHGQFFRYMTEKWNEANPDRPVDLKVEIFPFEDMHNKLLVSLQSGSGAPDLADIEIGKFPNFLKGTPQLAELNDIVEPELPNLVKSRFDIYAKDGKYYGVDYHVGASVIYYNTDILERAGVNPDDIDTWDDFVKAGRTVKEKTGVPMTTVESQEHWSLWPLVAQRGGDFLDEDGNIALDSDINIKTLTFLQDLVKEGIAVIAPGGFHHSEEYYGFMNQGGAASVWMPMWYMGRFTDYMPDLKGKIAIKPMPAWPEGGGRSAGMGGTGTVVTNQSKNVELAKELLAFAKISNEGNIQLWQFLGFDPIRTETWSDPALREPNKFTAYFGDNIFDTLLEFKDEIAGVTIGERTPDVISAIQTQVMPSVMNDMKDPAATLKAVADELRR